MMSAPSFEISCSTDLKELVVCTELFGSNVAYAWVTSDNTFARAIGVLLSTLALFNPHENARIRLSLRVTLPPLDPHSYAAQMWSPSQRYWVADFHRGVLQEFTRTLPPVTCVWGLDLNSYGRATTSIHPDVFSQLSKFLPGLVSVKWRLEDVPRYMSSLRLGLRLAFVGSFLEENPSLPSLECLLIAGDKEPDPLHHEYPPQACIHAGHDDPLRSVIDGLSRLPRLRKLQLGSSSAPMCFPSDWFDGRASSPAAWPSLRELVVWIERTTPTGEWYFEGEPTDTWTVDVASAGDIAGPILWTFAYHLKPETGAFTPLISSLARAVSRMAALQRIDVQFDSAAPTGYYTPPFTIAYWGPGQPQQVSDANERDHWDDEFHERHKDYARWVFSNYSFTDHDSNATPLEGELEGFHTCDWVLPPAVRAILHRAAEDTKGRTFVLVHNGFMVGLGWECTVELAIGDRISLRK